MKKQVDTEVIIAQVDSLRSIYKADLERKLENLVLGLSIELEHMKSNPQYRPNSCGIIQGSASEIDELCVKLGVLEAVSREY